MEQKVTISRAGYEELEKMRKEEKKKLSEQIKHDLVGALYNLPDYLTIEDRQESKEATKLFRTLTEYLNDYPFELRNYISELANNYGLATEESGFRRGFHMAMQLCMDGMKGGAY